MFKIGDKVRITGGTHFKKKQPVKWGILKSQTKTFCKIDFHDYIQSKERGDAEDEVVVKEIQVASKFLEKVPDLVVEMPTADDLVVVDKLQEEEHDFADLDNVEMNITEKEANEFDKEGMRILDDEEVWDGGDDPPITFEDLNEENEANKAMVINLQNKINMLQDELSGAIANAKGSGLLEENMKLKELLKIYL